MAIDKPPKPNLNKREFGITCQVRKEGVSSDYNNRFMMGRMFCKALLNKPGFKISHFAESETELKTKILEVIKKLPSYTEYMTMKGKTNGIGLEDFLTERGKEIVARLDQITAELKSLLVEDPDKLNVEKVLALGEESSNLIYEQGEY